MSKKKIQRSAEERSQRSGNLSEKVSKWRFVKGLTLPFLSGAILSLLFPNFSFGFLAFVILLPTLFIALKDLRGGFWTGYIFGFGYFGLSMTFVNPIVPGGSFILSIFLSLYPALWLKISKSFLSNLIFSKENDLSPKQTNPERGIKDLSLKQVLLFILFSSALWVSLEWFRSWILTGLTWNQLGYSQWQNLSFSQMSRFTGIYGLTFIIVLINLFIYFSIQLKSHRKILIPAAVIILVCSHLVPKVKLPEPDSHYRVGVVQGNVPIKVALDARNLYDIINNYYQQSVYIATKEKPDLIIWGETVIPRTMTVNANQKGVKDDSLECHIDLHTIIKHTNTKLLMGTQDHGFQGKFYWNKPRKSYNAAVLFDENAKRKSHYYKRHLVPFGEFIPLEKSLPKSLMNRLKQTFHIQPALHSGEVSNLFEIDDVLMGCNICYEDCFPLYSRDMTNNGANVILTLTNDSWFEETNGSMQHLSHGIFRSIENIRPTIRVGNNSGSCLIMPDGTIRDLLENPDTGEHFYKGSAIIEIPLWQELPKSFYTKYGDVFAWLMSIIAFAMTLYCIYRHIDRKKRLYKIMNPDIANENQTESVSP